MISWPTCTVYCVSVFFMRYIVMKNMQDTAKLNNWTVHNVILTRKKTRGKKLTIMSIISFVKSKIRKSSI